MKVHILFNGDYMRSQTDSVYMIDENRIIHVVDYVIELEERIRKLEQIIEKQEKENDNT